jgi:hypothetical protein
MLQVLRRHFGDLVRKRRHARRLGGPDPPITGGVVFIDATIGASGGFSRPGGRPDSLQVESMKARSPASCARASRGQRGRGVASRNRVGRTTICVIATKVLPFQLDGQRRAKETRRAATSMGVLSLAGSGYLPQCAACSSTTTSSSGDPTAHSLKGCLRLSRAYGPPQKPTFYIFRRGRG